MGQLQKSAPKMAQKSHLHRTYKCKKVQSIAHKGTVTKSAQKSFKMTIKV